MYLRQDGVITYQGTYHVIFFVFLVYFNLYKYRVCYHVRLRIFFWKTLTFYTAFFLTLKITSEAHDVSLAGL